MGGFRHELPLEVTLRLEQVKDILHVEVSSASVKAGIPSPYSAASAEPRVSTLELFFDLVFVFTITQLTSFLLRDPTIAGLVQMVLLFGNVWWMYGGYAWLTNAVPPRGVAVRLLLLVGMGGFLLIALSIPTAFGRGGVAFGIGYMVVTLVHTGLFWRGSQQSIASAIGRLGPFNLITAALLLVAGFTPGGVRIVLFAVGGVLHWITPYLIHQSAFTIRAGHFVERHGLIVLIAIGESVVAVGIGLGAIELPAGRIVAALLGLALTAALWWLYFDGDDARAEAALEAAPPERKPWIALNAFGYAFVPILGGIVLFAAGLKLAVVRYNEPSTVSAAVFLAAGVAIYLAGLALFRWLIDVHRIAVRLLMAVVALMTTFIGLGTTPVIQLAALVLILVAGNIVESRAGSADVRPRTA
jgi:low temperature requirement protein LtrA